MRTALLRVRIWPEYPERYLSKIIWASKPDCGPRPHLARGLPLQAPPEATPLPPGLRTPLQALFLPGRPRSDASCVSRQDDKYWASRSPEGNTEGPGTASSEPLLPS